MKKKIVLIVCDGMGDLPVADFGNKTPLEAAKTPNMDWLAQNGKTGTMFVLGEGRRPNSDEAHLTLFGYDLERDYPGRGPIEAAGAGADLQDGDVAIRANLATVDKALHVLDRRCDRIEDTSPFVMPLNGTEIDGVKFLITPGTGYRVVIVMRGKGLSDKISNSDVHYVTEDKIVEEWQNLPVNKINALDNSPEAIHTAEALQKFLDKAHEIMEANPLNNQRQNEGKPRGNYFLTRGPGYYKQLEPFQKKWGWRSACIAGAGLYKGLGVMSGMELVKVAGATGLPNTNVEAKMKKVLEILPTYDFIFVHIKPTDIFGENGDCVGKRDFIEKIDHALGLLKGIDAKIVITADHSTPCSHKDHSADPVPFLIYYEGIKPDNMANFGETECKKGSLGTINGVDFMKLVDEV